MKVVHIDEVEKVKVQTEGARCALKQLPIGSGDGAPNFSFRVFTIEPGGHTPYHAHPFEHVNYIISGEGALVDEGDNVKPLKAGDFALVLPNEKHQYRNTSQTEDMVMICAVTRDYE